MATVIATRSCPACDFERAEVREGKKGATSIYCPECGFQGLAKSPKASAALRARHERQADEPSGEAKLAPKSGGEDDFDAFIGGKK